MITVKHIAIATMLATATQPALAHEIDDQGRVIGHLPVGDGDVSTTAPQVGYVFSCTSDFRAGGARHYGDWLKGDTFVPAEKVVVRGATLWPEAYLRITDRGDTLFVETNGLPIGQPTGDFPISRDDPAYQYDTNPNPVKAQELAFSIPANPVPASQPNCLRRGMIGFTITGVALYNALDDAGLDAAAHEVQDACAGHPSGRGQYHYHASSPCIPGVAENAQIGWALDGYPILGMRDASGTLMSNGALDECHGRTEEWAIDGREYNYAYRLTPEYPYSIGCYRGDLLRGTNRDIAEGLQERRGRGARDQNQRERRPNAAD